MLDFRFSREGTSISHLMFADDLLIAKKLNTQELKQWALIFKKLCSGLGTGAKPIKISRSLESRASYPSQLISLNWHLDHPSQVTIFCMRALPFVLKPKSCWFDVMLATSKQLLSGWKRNNHLVAERLVQIKSVLSNCTNTSINWYIN